MEAPLSGSSAPGDDGSILNSRSPATLAGAPRRLRAGPRRRPSLDDERSVARRDTQSLPGGPVKKRRTPRKLLPLPPRPMAPPAKVPWAAPLLSAADATAQSLVDAQRLWAGDDAARLQQAAAMVRSAEMNDALLADTIRAEQLQEEQRTLEMRSLRHLKDRLLLSVVQDRQRKAAHRIYARLKHDTEQSLVVQLVKGNFLM
ncbi:hypothetical protein M885DRAFT_506538 [Pelagophyceae sp. CCMP2097]|nr:hypothetical protein M885DRAFT_506538 [Pelagophyceae sp. CCMP2097]